MQISSKALYRRKRRRWVICAGTAMMDALAVDDSVSQEGAVKYEVFAGGTAANVAVGLSRLGLRVRFVGKVGRDPFGETLEDCLRENGVDTSYLSFSESSRTGLMVQGKGKIKRAFYRHPGADEQLGPKDVSAIDLRETLLFYTDSTCLTDEPSRSVLRQLLEKSIDEHVQTCFDVNLRGELWRSQKCARRHIRTGIQLANVVKSTAEELTAIVPGGNLKSCMYEAFLLSKNLKLLVVTFGDKGSLFKNQRHECFSRSYRVRQVDGTGCGDAFMAALIYSLLLVEGGLEGLDEQQLLSIGKFANAAGALTATRKGTIPAIPTLREVEAFMNEREKDARTRANRR